MDESSRTKATHSEWAFPFPPPGRPKSGSVGSIPPRSAYRWPYRSLDEERELPCRGVDSPVPLDEFKRELRARSNCDDVGVISVDDPAVAHEFDEIRYIYPHAKSLICLIGEENKPALQSRYLPTANHELYSCEERIFGMGRLSIAYIKTLGGEGLSTTIGWPQEVSRRWADKIWPLSHKLVAQAAGLGVIGLSRNFLHRKFGAYCLIDTLITNLEFAEYDGPIAWNPCLECNLCVASCPTEAIRADGDFDFFACYNHTYRDSIPGFLDLVRDLGEAKPKRFLKRWTDIEIAALWQSLAYRVEYRCFNCVATCPAELHEDFHADKAVRRRYLDETLKPLATARLQEEQRFVIDTPTARRKYGIPPGEWRTPADPAQPASKVVRLVDLHRVRTQDIDAMMRNMPQYFRDVEAGGLEFTTQFTFEGRGGGDWVMRIANRRCAVRPGTTDSADLGIRCDGAVFLAIHRAELSPLLAVVTGRLKLTGDPRLFLTFARIFAQPSGNSWLHRMAHRIGAYPFLQPLTTRLGRGLDRLALRRTDSGKRR
ncbi:MAG: SCP2 sterol-binding domain-containing protein [Candidatus Binatia bacterium]